ncbi:DNA repair protein RadC [Paenibacillus chitinolyticus]|uniref:RadC family protein n=1 Tax=Paenibacillus TaxID=44249 RepID=UPI0020C6285A|nr:DNA repair protein RadC [Paenibacillus sp. GbtcB18]
MISSIVTLREIPPEERPRERMMQVGASSLSSAELLAILVRTGTYSESALALAQRILSDTGGLRGLVEASREELVRIKGIGDAKALQIMAGIELGRRISRTRTEEITTVRSPFDVFDLLKDELRYLQKEHFVCLFLNTKNHIIGRETLSIGSLNASIVHPREVFRAAIQRSSASIVCVHNHPSGDPTPSPQDIELTHRLTEAGDIIGIEVLDHIVIGDDRYVSLKEHGHM